MLQKHLKSVTEGPITIPMAVPPAYPRGNLGAFYFFQISLKFIPKASDLAYVGLLWLEVVPCVAVGLSLEPVLGPSQPLPLPVGLA